MPDSLACLIVDEALAIQRSRPELPALALLDLVMRGRRGTSPDFGPLDPSSDFGMLLAAAFDEQMTFSGVRTLGESSGAARPNAFEEYWVERVMRAFALRYSLRQPRAGE